MLLSKIDLNCSYHPGQKVIMVDQTPQIQGNSRALCPSCIQNITQKQKSQFKEKSKLDFITIEDFSNRANNYGIQQEIQIKNKYEQEQQRLNEFNKSLTTLRDQTTAEFDRLIQIVQENLNSLSIIIMEELQNLKGFSQIMSYKRLIEIADILVKEGQEDSINNLINDIMQGVILTISDSTLGISNHIIQNSTFLCNKKESIINNHNQNIFSFQQSIIPKEITKVRIVSQHDNVQVDNLKNNIFGSLFKPIEQNQIAQKKTPRIEQQIDFDQECQILVSNSYNSIIVGGVRFLVMICKQVDKKIERTEFYPGHLDLVTGLIVYNAKKMIVSGALDKMLCVWKESKKSQEWQIRKKQQLSHQIIQLLLTPNEQQIIVGYKELFIHCLTMNASYELSVVQQVALSRQLISINVNPRGYYLAVGCSDRSLQLYDNKQLQLWWLQCQNETKGVIQQLYFTQDDELFCLQSQPSTLFVYNVSNEKFAITLTIALNVCETMQSFPLFKIDQMICCQHGQTIYLINKKQGQYQIDFEIIGNYEAACADVTNSLLILRDYVKKQLQICRFD